MIGLPASRDGHEAWDLASRRRKCRAKRGVRAGGGGVTRSLGEELERQPLSQFCRQSCPVSGYCRTGISPPRYYGDQSFACPAGAAASSSGNGEWKLRTRAGKAGAERRPSPRAPRWPASARTHAGVFKCRGPSTKAWAARAHLRPALAVPHLGCSEAAPPAPEPFFRLSRHPAGFKMR